MTFHLKRMHLNRRLLLLVKYLVILIKKILVKDMASEKENHKNYHRLKRKSLNNYNYTKWRTLLERIDIETYRIMSHLNLPLILTGLIRKKFMEVWRGLNPDNKFRNSEKLLEISTYFILMSLKLPINENELLKMSVISKMEFYNLKQILKRKIN